MNKHHTTSKSAAAFALCIAAFLFGCEPKVPSPRNPQVEIPISVAIVEAEVIAKEKKQEAKQADSKFKLAAQKIQSQAEIDLAELTAAHDEAVEKALSQAVAVRDATVAAIKAAEERCSVVLTAIGQAGEIASQTGIPGVASIGGLLTGVVGLAAAYRSKSKATTAEEAAAAEAQARKEQEAIAARIIDSLDVLKHLSPEVAAAFKTHGATLAEWQGPQAVSFINKIQQS